MKLKKQVIETIEHTQKLLASKVNELLSNKEVQASLESAKKYSLKAAHNLKNELQKYGKLSADEAKKLLKEVDKRAGTDKARLYKSIKRDSESLLTNMSNVIINSLALAKSYTGNKSKSSKKTRKSKSA